MTLNEELLDSCGGRIYLLYRSPVKRFNLLVMRTNQQKKVDNFQRNAQGGHLFSPFGMRLISVAEKLTS